MSLKIVLDEQSYHLDFWFCELDQLYERIYNPITATGFSAMFAFQLYNTEVNCAGIPLR